MLFKATMSVELESTRADDSDDTLPLNDIFVDQVEKPPVRQRPLRRAVSPGYHAKRQRRPSCTTVGYCMVFSTLWVFALCIAVGVLVIATNIELTSDGVQQLVHYNIHSHLPPTPTPPP